jgi:predicted glutamine amidotransferase
MQPTDSLLLDAKQAILEEQHRRFKALREEGRWQEALQQFQITLACASDLLNHSLEVLDHVLAERRRLGAATTPDSPPPPAS